MRGAPPPARRRRPPRSTTIAPSPSGPIEPAIRTSRAGDLPRLAGELHGLAVDPRDVVVEVVRRELGPVRAERVRLDQLGAGLDVADVHRHDDLGRDEVRLLGHAQPARRGARDQRAHAAVGDDRRPRREALEEPAHRNPVYGSESENEAAAGLVFVISLRRFACRSGPRRIGAPQRLARLTIESRRPIDPIPRSRLTALLHPVAAGSSRIARTPITPVTLVGG